MTSGGKNSNIGLIVYFFNANVFRHLWQLKTAVFLHRCLICFVLLPDGLTNQLTSKGLGPGFEMALGVSGPKG